LSTITSALERAAVFATSCSNSFVLVSGSCLDRALRVLTQRVELLVGQPLFQPRRDGEVDRADRAEHDQPEHDRQPVAQRPHADQGCDYSSSSLNR
jgi:hypothetical protein